MHRVSTATAQLQHTPRTTNPLTYPIPPNTEHCTNCFRYIPVYKPGAALVRIGDRFQDADLSPATTHHHNRKVTGISMVFMDNMSLFSLHKNHLSRMPGLLNNNSIKVL